MDLRFLGATGTVTGSKYLLTAGGSRVMVDCGLFQGYKQLRLRNWDAPVFDPASIDAVVLTHAHLDHSGYLPLLVRHGFRGRIICTPPTYDLCRVMLPDSGRIQEEDAEHANRHGHSKHSPALPLYTEADAFRALDCFETRAFHQTFEPAPGLSVELLRAGHLLGAAMVAVRCGDTRLLFSGDLGRPNDPLLPPPEQPGAADILVVESTYGNRCHDKSDPAEQLAAVVRRVAARKGVILVPAFTVGRTQTLLHYLAVLKASGRIPRDLPVYLNSPMAIDATRIYRTHAAEHRLSLEQSAAMGSVATLVNTLEESKQLNLRKGPMLIIAGSGMATGGRIVHHLKAFGPDPANAIVLTGFQAGGTRGAALQAGADSIKIHGEYVAVRAEVVSLSNLSAHADSDELMAWLGGMRAAPRRVFITHGEPDASDALRRRIEEQLRWTCRVPEYGEVAALDER